MKMAQGFNGTTIFAAFALAGIQALAGPVYNDPASGGSAVLKDFKVHGLCALNTTDGNKVLFARISMGDDQTGKNITFMSEDAVRSFVTFGNTAHQKASQGQPKDAMLLSFEEVLDKMRIHRADQTARKRLPLCNQPFIQT